MTVETELAQRASTRRVGVGILELVPEEPSGPVARLRANLHDRVLVLLVAVLVAAQAADVVTTYRAIWRQNYVEQNPLFRALLNQSAVGGFSLKLLLVAGITALVMTTLRGNRAAVALALAASISLTAPVLNFMLLMRG